MIIDDITSFKHYPRLRRKDVTADIEIHRVPVTLKDSKQFSTDLIFQCKKVITNMENCYVQTDEHKVIHNFIHSQLSNFGHKHKIISLRDLYDFHLLSKRVDLEKVLSLIEEKRKAKIYFHFAKYVFSENKNKLQTENNTGKQFILTYNWFLVHPKEHQIYISFFKIIDILILRPFKKINDAIFLNSARKSLCLRLKSAEWYSTTYRGIKNLLITNKKMD